MKSKLKTIKISLWFPNSSTLQIYYKSKPSYIFEENEIKLKTVKISLLPVLLGKLHKNNENTMFFCKMYAFSEFSRRQHALYFSYCFFKKMQKCNFFSWGNL